MLLAPRSVTFDDFRFNTLTRELLRIENDGSATALPLGLRAADLLRLFLDRPGELITKSEIMDAVWPNTAVEESNLTVQISALRRALDNRRKGASCIQTVAGRGYRFILPVDDPTDRNVPVGAPGALEANAVLVPAQGPLTMPGSIAAESSQQHANATPETNADARRTEHWRTALAAIALLLCMAVIVFLWRGRSSDRTVLRAEPPRLSIVALPFVNASGEPRDDDLAAALTEDVATSLAQTPGAFVVARSMAQATASRKLSLQAIGNDVGVRYVLEGTIRRSSEAVQLKVQLSEAASGASVWAAQYQGSAREPRDQIARSLLFPVRMAFMDAEAQRLSTLPPAALTVEDLLLKVRAANNHQPITPARSAENIALLERALALAPNSAELLIGLAFEHLRPIVEFGDPARDEQWLQAVAYVDRARAVAAGSEPMLGLQAYLLHVEGRFDEAVAAYKALMQAAPGTTHYHVELARNLILTARSAEAAPLLEEVIKRGDGAVPRFVPYWQLGQAFLRLGRNDEAIQALLAAREQSSGFIPEIYLRLTAAYANAGRIEEARRELREFVKERPTTTVRSVRHAAKSTPQAAEELQREIDGLVRAGLRDHVDEDADTGLPITAGVQARPLNAPTPRGGPGISVIATPELSALINRQSGENDRPLLLSTMCTYCFDIAFPDSIHVPQYLRQEPMNDDMRRALKAWIDPLLGGNPARRLITLSWHAERWHGRNLALELVALGYPNVSWYRGGLEAWDAAGLPVRRLLPATPDRN